MNILKRIWNPVFAAWMKFAHVLGIVNTTILLTIVYLIVILPTRAILLLMQRDALHLRMFRTGATWHERSPEKADISERTHPF